MASHDAARRSFCIAAAAAALAPRSIAAAERVWRLAGIGWHPRGGAQRVFYERLAEHGFVQGRNLEVGFFFPKRYPLVTRKEMDALVADAIAWKPDLMATIGSANARSIRAATSSIPAVFGFIDDPVADGLVATMGRPGGNLTGAAFAGDPIVAKRLELVRELLPSARRVGVTYFGSEGDPTRSLGVLRAAARVLGIELLEVDLATAAGGVDAGLRRLAAGRVQAIVCVGFTESSDRDAWKKEVEFQNASRVPLIDWIPDSVDEGAIVGLGERIADHWRRMADVAAKVLEGRTPIDRIPVDATARIQLALNRGAARRIGIEVPPSVLVRADRVVD